MVNELSIHGSEFHVVWSITFGEGESSAKVLGNHLVLDVLDQGSVNFLLQLLSGIRSCALGSVLCEESLRSSSLYCGFLLGESFIGDSVNLNTSHVNFGAGAHGVNLRNSLAWDTVELVWSCNTEKSGFQLFEANNSLSSESS